MADQSRIITRKAVKEDMADVILMIQVRALTQYRGVYMLVLPTTKSKDKKDFT